MKICILVLTNTQKADGASRIRPVKLINEFNVEIGVIALPVYLLTSKIGLLHGEEKSGRKCYRGFVHIHCHAN